MKKLILVAAAATMIAAPAYAAPGDRNAQDMLDELLGPRLRDEKRVVSGQRPLN